MTYLNPSVFDRLSDEQRAAVRHGDGPAAVYAGPGSGKTRVVTLRAARLASEGKRLLVTTFTSDATEEMKNRIGEMLPKEHAVRAHVTTLHALCLQILKAHVPKFSLLTDEFLRRNLAETAGGAEVEGGISAFLSRLSYQKNVGQTAQTYKHDGSSDDMDFARAWRAYEKAKHDKNLREFDDLILEAGALLESDPDLRGRLASLYNHIIVDECQDMNRPQYGVALALGRDHQNVMLVGDLDQSLYAFRGADSTTFQQFASHSRTRVYELRANYRCTQSVLAFADSLIRQDESRRVLAFVPTRPEGDPVTWQRYPDADVEALAVGEQILRLSRRGATFQDIAVLYRTNAQSEALQRHFAALAIPYTIRNDGDFYARREVQGMLAYLNFFGGAGGQGPGASEAVPQLGQTSKRRNASKQAVSGPRPLTPGSYPDEWLLALLNVPNRKLSREIGGLLRNHAEIRGKRIWDILPDFHAPDLRAHKALRGMTQELKQIESKISHIAHAGDAIRAIRVATHFDDWLRRDGERDDKDNDRIQNIQRMQEAAAHYATIADYLAAVQKVRDEAARRKSERAKKRREQNEVMLSTGHAAKGLEWKYVFAIGWSEEILPHRKAEDIAEERRIAYVIATRARDLLCISSLDSWNDATVAPSRFLTGLSLASPPAQEDEENDEGADTDIDYKLPELAGAYGGLFDTF